MVGPSWIVLVRTGKRAGQKTVLAPDGTLRVGRVTPSELVIGDDRDLSDVHFTLSAAGGACRLEDAKSEKGTEVNGLRVEEADIGHGDWVHAGATDFSIYREGHTPPLDDIVVTPEKHAALDQLRAAPDRLFAVLDAARAERIVEIVREATEETRSLYEGAAGENMADGAPYLVDVGRGALLERVVLEGWGQSWGIFLTSSQPFAEVRKHFRRFLVVVNDDTEERLYFRFYDPRVLRVFLPTCTKRQSTELFGELGQFLMEDEHGQLLRFAKGGAAVSS